MGRLEVRASRDREATLGLEAVSPGPTEEYCQGGDGAGAGQGPQQTGDPSPEVGMWRGQWGRGHKDLDWSKSKPARL